MWRHWVILALFPLCRSFDYYGGQDYWYRCSDPAHTEMWITCNLKKVIEERTRNTTNEILEALQSQVAESLEKQTQMLQYILKISIGDSEVEKPRDCSSATPGDFGFRSIYPYSCSESVTVLCSEEYDEYDKTVILKRRFQSVDVINFYRPWEDYKSGFGTYEDYWIGLEKLHHITKDHEYTLEITGYDMHYNYAHGKWHNFRVLGEDQQYELQIGNFNVNGSTLKNDLSDLNGLKFSTFDRDNDKHRENCSEKRKGGWWYSDCGSVNPTGLLRNATSFADTATWTGWHDQSKISLHDIEISIYPNKGQPLHRICHGKDGNLDPYKFN